MCHRFNSAKRRKHICWSPESPGTGSGCPVSGQWHGQPGIVSATARDSTWGALPTRDVQPRLRVQALPEGSVTPRAMPRNRPPLLRPRLLQRSGVGPGPRPTETHGRPTARREPEPSGAVPKWRRARTPSRAGRGGHGVSPERLRAQSRDAGLREPRPAVAPAPVHV